MMEIFAFGTSVSSIVLVLFSTVIFQTKSGLSLPLSEDATSDGNNSEDSVADIETICNTQQSVSTLKQLSLYSTDCKSNDKDFWVKNCRCSHDVNCDQGPKCPQEMTTSTAKTTLPTTTLLSSILLSSLSAASTGAAPTSPLSSTTRYLPAVTNSAVSITNSSSVTSTKSHEELPTPSKLAQANNNFIRLG